MMTALKLQLFQFAWILFTDLAIVSSALTECGGYNGLSSLESGVITSPNYPNKYPAKAYCIWTLQSKALETINMTIYGMAGQDDSRGGCHDYLEVRAGNPSAELLFYNCTDSSVVTFVSPSRWLWLRFHSDAFVQNTGFRASYAAIADENATETEDAFEHCHQQFSCPNKQCVSRAYICDGYPDCGCVDDCDEDAAMCNPQGLSTGTRLWIGCTVGAVVFLLTVISVGIYEWKSAEGKKKEWAAVNSKSKQRRQKKAQSSQGRKTQI